MLQKFASVSRRFTTSAVPQLFVRDLITQPRPRWWDKESFASLMNLPINPEMLPDRISIVEVGPRDGLQYEKKPWSFLEKSWLVGKLVDCGMQDIEIGSLVSPKLLPQMQGSDKLYSTFIGHSDVRFHMLVPNPKKMEEAIKLGVKFASIFVSPSEHFSKRNINRSVEESMQDARISVEMAHAEGIYIRGYVSCIFDSPDESEVIQPQSVVDISERLLGFGCYEVSLGDTLGKGTPVKTSRLLSRFDDFCREQVAMHFHDTFGNGAANFLTSMHFGVTTFDSSIAGLGGCPFAGSTSGNVDTRKLLYLCNALHIENGVEHDRFMRFADKVELKIGSMRGMKDDLQR